MGCKDPDSIPRIFFSDHPTVWTEIKPCFLWWVWSLSQGILALSDLYFLLMKPTSFWYQHQGNYFLTRYLLKFEVFGFVYTFFDNLPFTFLLLSNQDSLVIDRILRGKCFHLFHIPHPAPFLQPPPQISYPQGAWWWRSRHGHNGDRRIFGMYSSSSPSLLIPTTPYATRREDRIDRR